MKNKKQQFLNKIYDSSFQTVGNVLTDFMDYLEVFMEDGLIDATSLELRYRLNRYYRSLCVYKDDPKMIELTARNMFKHDYSYEDGSYTVEIIVKDTEIVLTIAEKEHGDYLKTNAFLFSKTQNTYFDCKYTVRFVTQDDTGYKDPYDIGDIFKEHITNDYLDYVNDLVITKEDKKLFGFFKYCKDENMVKQLLNDLIDFYLFCNSDSGIQEGHLTPENYRDRVLKNKTREELLELKNKYEKDILLYVSDFHPDECDCGIMRGPDTEYWFIDEDSRLGFITLYSNYIKMIDELLIENK